MGMGTRVRYYRNKLQWTLEDLAGRAGVEVGTISALENRDSKRSQFTAQLAAAFGLTVEQLCDESRDWLAGAPTPADISLSVANEPRAPYSSWPFEGVSREQYYTLLTDADRAAVLGFINGLIHSRTSKRAVA